MTFKEIRQASGMNLTQFSEYFGIPYRTIQHWEQGTRQCPEYLLELIQYKLNTEPYVQRTVPKGYKLEAGKLVLDQEEAEKIKTAFEEIISKEDWEQVQEKMREQE